MFTNIYFPELSWAVPRSGLHCTALGVLSLVKISYKVWEVQRISFKSQHNSCINLKNYQTAKKQNQNKTMVLKATKLIQCFPMAWDFGDRFSISSKRINNDWHSLSITMFSFVKATPLTVTFQPSPPRRLTQTLQKNCRSLVCLVVLPEISKNIKSFQRYKHVVS